MHEAGLVAGILDAAAQTARQAQATSVLAVRVRIGEMCEVVPESLDFAWQAMRGNDPITHDAELIVDSVAPRSACISCGAEFSHDRYHCRCPECGSAQTLFLAGREMEIVSVEIDIPDAGA